MTLPKCSIILMQQYIDKKKYFSLTGQYPNFTCKSDVVCDTCCGKSAVCTRVVFKCQHLTVYLFVQLAPCTLKSHGPTVRLRINLIIIQHLDDNHTLV